MDEENPSRSPGHVKLTALIGGEADAKDLAPPRLHAQCNWQLRHSRRIADWENNFGGAHSFKLQDSHIRRPKVKHPGVNLRISIMPKNKKKYKDKPPPNLKPEFVLTPDLIKPKKPKKNAPDRPQPEWMFPPDSENPVLNPKPKSDAKIRKDAEDHDTAVNFLHYKSVTAPVKAAPPATLLTLVGAFLTSYGFNSTSRIYTTELAARKKLDEWNVVINEKLPQGCPDLVKIFKDGYKTWEITRDDATSSSGESEDDASEESKSEAPMTSRTADDESTREESESSDSDPTGISESGRTALAKDKWTKKQRQAKKSASTSSSASASDSDSDADDEKDAGGVQTTNKKPARPSSLAEVVDSPNKSEPAVPPSSKPTITETSTTGSALSKVLTTSSNNAPRSSSSDVSDSSSESESTHLPIQSSQVHAASSTSDSGSTRCESESDASPKPASAKTVVTVLTQEPSTKERTGSSSSETLQATSTQKLSTANTSVPTSDASANDPVFQGKVTTITNQKRKRSPSPAAGATQSSKKHQKAKAPNTPFQRVPRDTVIDERFASNKYHAYDYADQAHNDLSVVRGKGFTKEKNKKKRGSYRGGAIDIAGGKGIKFDE